MAKRIELNQNTDGNNSNDYVLGTNKDELHRLGLQHQVWAEEARKGWDTAEFGRGQTILDLGCGPGFASRDLSYIVGKEGKVIAVDKSQTYIDFLNQIKQLHDLNIDTQCADFDNMALAPMSLDGVFCRWALLWVANPAEIVQKIADAMRPGAAFVAHEYFDWSTHQTYPHYEGLAKAIDIAFHSMQKGDGDMNIGRELPGIFYESGLEVIITRPMAKLGVADSMAWQWPMSFYEIYFPKLVQDGLLTEDEYQTAMDEIDQIEMQEGAILFGPMMMETVAIKV
jgi:SAM-dependent methyltransferase